jgi:hypothetical protein
MLNENEIIPQNYQNDLMVLRDVDTKIQFSVGDITLLIIEEHKANKKLYPVLSIYKAVASFVGRSSRTVREYAMIARFFTPEIREAYAILAFEHFKTAALMASRWREVLEWSIQNGKPATVDSVLQHFGEHNNAEAEDKLMIDDEREMLSVVNRHISGIKAVFEDRKLPSTMLNKLWTALQQVDSCCQEMICLLES